MHTSSLTINSTSLDNNLILNELIIEPKLWQVHNCKIITMEATQDYPLPFLYHYDTLSDELKRDHPLTPQLLAQFNTLMSAAEACQRLKLPADTIQTPWQVKVIGTLVIYSETLQLALRLRFSNTAKARDPIYTDTKEQAIEVAMRNWHFFGDVFILNKQSKPLIIVASDDSVVPSDKNTDMSNDDSHDNHDDHDNHNTPDSKQDNNASDIHDNELVVDGTLIYHIPTLAEYQHIPSQYAVVLLTALDAHKSALPYLDEAIQLRVS